MIGDLMAKAVQPAVTAGEIFFELDRFELGDGDRLELSGRWFGVRGRRFVRPSLALIADGGRSRALADLEHKPWAPEDGQAWEAAFPWHQDADVVEVELSVAPDITIRLPIPSSELDRAQRLDAIPRQDRRTLRPAESEFGDQASDGASAKPSPRRTAKSADGEGELASVRDELSAVRDELEKLRAELEVAQVASAESANAAAAAGVELAAAIEARDAASRAGEAASAQRDRERQERELLAAERDRAEQTVRRIGSELEQAQGALQKAVGERDALLHSGERLAHERDEAIAARGAALVMRNATRALPGHARHAGWLQRGGAIVVLVGAIFALLIVLHLL